MEQQEQSRITEAMETYCKYYKDDVAKRFGGEQKEMFIIQDAYCVGLSVEWTCDLIERAEEEIIYQCIIYKAKHFLENVKTGSLEDLQLRNLLADYRGQLYQYYTQRIYQYCIS